jgi:hypothetical protein
MRSIYVFAALSCLAAVGCGDDDGLPPGGKDLSVGADLAVSGDLSTSADLSAGVDMSSGITWAKFSLDFAQARCARLMSCGQLDAAQLDVCITQNLQLTGWDIDTEIAKGRLLLNETQCIAALAASRCDGSDSGLWQERCTTLLDVPQQAIGAVCLSGVECTSTFCAHSVNGAGTAPQPDGCPGLCTAIKPVGAPCQTDEQCGPDSFCDNDNSNNNVITNTCVAYLGVGDDCGAIENPKQTCHPGTTYCPVFGTPNCIVPPPSAALGGACDPSQGFSNVPPCVAGLFCQVNATRDGATCQPKIAAGASCNGGDTISSQGLELIDNQCVDGTGCFSLDNDPLDTAGTCIPYGGSGDTCKQISNTISSCKIGFLCETSGAGVLVGTCVPLLANGAQCSLSASCASSTGILQNTCIADNGDAGGVLTCQAAKGFGDSCLPDFQGALCWPAADVGTSYCAPTSNGNGVCAPLCN